MNRRPDRAPAPLEPRSVRLDEHAADVSDCISCRATTLTKCSRYVLWCAARGTATDHHRARRVRGDDPLWRRAWRIGKTSDKVASSYLQQ